MSGNNGHPEDSDFGDNEYHLADVDREPIGAGPRPSAASRPGWRDRVNSTMRDISSRRMLIGVTVVVLIGIVYAIWPRHQKAVVSTAAPVPNMNVPQASSVPSPAYNQALQTADQQRAATATSSGGSALPTVAQQPQPTDDLGSNSLPSIEIPDNGATQAQPPPVIPTTPSSPPVPTAPSSSVSTANRGEAPNVMVVNQQRVQAIQQYMQGLGSAVGQAQIVSFGTNSGSSGGSDDDSGSSAGNSTPTDNRAMIQNASSDTGNTSGTAAGSNSNSNTDTAGNANLGPYAVPVPGTMLYSQMLSGVNSDDPGPIVAEVVQGPLSGARILGSFVPHKDGLTVNFDTMSIAYQDADGNTETEVLPIKAVAVSTDNLDDSIATSINDHLALKLGTAFVSGFLGNFGNLLAESGATTTSTGLGTIVTSNPLLSTNQELASAAGQAAGTTGQVLEQEFGNEPPTIKVASGTPFALLFVSSASSTQ